MATENRGWWHDERRSLTGAGDGRKDALYTQAADGEVMNLALLRRFGGSASAFSVLIQKFSFDPDNSVLIQEQTMRKRATRRLDWWPATHNAPSLIHGLYTSRPCILENKSSKGPTLPHPAKRITDAPASETRPKQHPTPRPPPLMHSSKHVNLPSCPCSHSYCSQQSMSPGGPSSLYPFVLLTLAPWHTLLLVTRSRPPSLRPSWPKPRRFYAQHDPASHCPCSR